MPHLVQGSLLVAAVASLLAIILFWSKNFDSMRNPGHIIMRRNAGLAGLAPAFLLCAAFCVQPIARATEANHLPECVANMRTLAMGMVMYTQDNEGYLPPTETWTDSLHGYLGPKADRVVKCPSSKSPFGYGMNATMESKTLDSVDAPFQMVLLFEATAKEANTAGERKDLARENRHGPGVHVLATCDGTAKPYSAKQLAGLKWANPTPEGHP